jgi:CPA2 family monovalent cation:H+ antiporter-2
MVMSLSLYSHTISKGVGPVKDLFMAVFFISIGLQISPDLIFENLGLAAIIAAVFIVSKILSVTLGCYIANMTAKDSLVIGMSLVAMGEFAFIIAKQALDAEVVSMNFYSAVIGAALMTMIIMPLLTKAQPGVLDWLWRHIPVRMRESMARIDLVRARPRKNRPIYTESEKVVKKGLFLIAIDCVVMLLIMVMFGLVGELERHFESTADYLNILPKELLMIAVILVLIPAIYNIRYHIRIIAGALTVIALESSQCNPKNAGFLFRVYFNLGTIAMFLLVMVIIVPFVPESTIISPVGLVMVLIGTGLVLYLAWDTIRRGYEKFFGMITGSEKNDDDGKKRE